MLIRCGMIQKAFHRYPEKSVKLSHIHASGAYRVIPEGKHYDHTVAEGTGQGFGLIDPKEVLKKI